MPRALIYAAFAAAAFGCATGQRVSLECVPKNVMVYVDGRLLEGSAKTMKLAKDQPHTVFLKGGGYQSQMLVFESREQDGKRVLDPADLCSRVTFVEMQPEVKIEVEPGAAP
jgi:hypothetical protein